MFEKIALGALQGAVEWLPISSEGALVLAKLHLFQTSQNLAEAIQEILFFHLGTFFAALVYFHKEVVSLLRTLFSFQPKKTSHWQLIRFLVVATLISGLLGFFLLRMITGLEEQVSLTTKKITFLIGFLLLGTGLVQIKAKKVGTKTFQDLTVNDAVLLGVAQGLASLPGFSRSGLTVSALLLRQFEKTRALKLSFLMSLPIVLAGNILLNLQYFSLRGDFFVGLLSTFLFGIVSIHLLLKLAAKVNFGYFVFLFGLLTIIAAFF